MRNYWLLKSDPDEYSYARLESDARAVWDGVANNLALKHLREMRQGDRFFCYHTGQERAIVGVGRVISDPYPDPSAADPRKTVIDVAPERRLPRPLTLEQIKGLPECADFALVRLPRLSVMPVSERLWQMLLKKML